MQDAVDDALAPQVCVNQIGGGTRTPIVAESSAPAAVVDAHWIRTTFWEEWPGWVSAMLLRKVTPPESSASHSIKNLAESFTHPLRVGGVRQQTDGGAQAQHSRHITGGEVSPVAEELRMGGWGSMRPRSQCVGRHVAGTVVL